MMTFLLCIAALAVVLFAPRMAGGGSLAVRDRRFSLPPEATAAGRLEMLHWPLYSAVALDAAALPKSVSFFGYARGAAVPGAGAAALASSTAFHTNLSVANQLARPETFTVFGVRIIVSPLSYSTNAALADDTVGVALENIDAVDDMLAILEATSFEFKVGQKTYIECPTWNLPAQTGIAGLFATSVSNTNAASVWQTRVAAHAGGEGFELPTFPILLANQQNFAARIVNDWTSSPALTDAKLVHCVLDGILGRAVQ